MSSTNTFIHEYNVLLYFVLILIMYFKENFKLCDVFCREQFYQMIMYF